MVPIGIRRKYMKRVFQTKKVLTGSNLYRKWSDYAEGDVVVGVFEGIHHDKFKKDNAKVKVHYAEFADGKGDDFVGKTLVINSCGSLEKALGEMTEGAAYQFVYGGKITLEKGPYAGKEAHTLSIQEVDLGSESEDSGEDYAL